ncbi:archaetidylserine decarboxylase [Paenibacillus thermotolerans]|uniref:archaetidylserine decarboxylase n=1 Tax=Paenibacillus thermotolerans TaxID=3027807 RepID=UPI0023684B7E|nr:MULTISPECIES: archaetidylserine decarboxylase [unclassified Paenibacillus]
MTWDAAFRLLTQLTSRPLLARMTGAAAKSRMSRMLLAKFASFYRIDIAEAEKPLTEYESLNDFFTRRLRPDARPIDPDEASLVSPVDGLVVETGEIQAGKLLPVKGQDYTAEQLLGGSPHASRYERGTFVVIYLSPSNYHRIHSPVDGTVLEWDRIPGTVYPVNDRGMRLMPQVLSSNARLVTYIRHPSGVVGLVKVGAMNVSSIQYARQEGPPESVRKGEELAFFEFGSTVVLLLEKHMFTPDAWLRAGAPVRMGQRIGTLKNLE